MLVDITVHERMHAVRVCTGVRVLTGTRVYVWVYAFICVFWCKYIYILT